MATNGARRLLPMANNTAGIVAIELLAAAQGIEFLRPLQHLRRGIAQLGEDLVDLGAAFGGRHFDRVALFGHVDGMGDEGAVHPGGFVAGGPGGQGARRW